MCKSFCAIRRSFGYNNLVVDMLGIPEMKKLGVPVTMDATHAVQLPGADPRTAGASTGGRREGVSVLAKSAIAAGANGVFLEFHPRPDEALCDAPSCLPLSDAKELLRSLRRFTASFPQIIAPYCQFGQTFQKIKGRRAHDEGRFSEIGIWSARPALAHCAGHCAGNAAFVFRYCRIVCRWRTHAGRRHFNGRMVGAGSHAFGGNGAGAAFADAEPQYFADARHGGQFRHPILFLLFGGFTLALVIEKCGLHMRAAYKLLSMLGVHARDLIAGLMVIAAFLSMWISNTSTTIMLLPVAISITVMVRQHFSRSTGATAW